MAGRLENQLLQWCGVDSTQTNDSVQEEPVKFTKNSENTSYFPTVTQASTASFIYPQTAGDYAPRLTSHNTQWASIDGMPGKSPNKDFISQFTMSGGPPHNPHGRQAPPNSAWNHLQQLFQVPNFYPRQPQHAHMSSELPLLASHQPTWHTPTREPSKSLPHNPLFNLQQMLSPERQFPRHSPGVDLTLTRSQNGSGSQNGDLPQTPISLSVRDAKQINSLHPSALEPERAVELTKVTSPGLQESQSPKNVQRKSQTKRVDSILERLNPLNSSLGVDKLPQSVIVTAASSNYDENSNSSAGTINIPSVPTREEEVVSPASTEDSLDSNKSRRKRKPNKTIKVPKEDEMALSGTEELPPQVPEIPEKPPQVEVPQIIETTPTPTEPEVQDVTPREKVEEELDLQDKKSPPRRRSSSEPSQSPPNKSRRKTLSESETIDNIAAMVAAPEVPVVEPPKIEEKAPETPKEVVKILLEEPKSPVCPPESEKSVVNEPPKVETVEVPSLSVMTPAQKKGDHCFVAVEDELEKMFAGIADSEEQMEASLSDPLALPSTSQNESVTSTSNDVGTSKPEKRMRQNKKPSSRRTSESNSTESTPRKKQKTKKREQSEEKVLTPKKGKKAIKLLQNQKEKEVYSYDSGSNASSSRSRGPFIQIRGPRDSPLSVSIVNAPSNEEDGEKPKATKNKKFHDDSEYRHKVRSKGLHCSTLSNKYDAQTRDVSWICVFCKRGPHATDPQLPGPSPFSLDMPHYSPGDLFGPYIISTDCPEYQRRIDDPYDALFKSKRSAMSLLMNNDAHTKTGKKAKKRLNSESNPRSSIDSTDENKDILLGIAEITPNSYEVWVHEDCVTWSPNVYLVGPKIVGLEGAVWSACSIVCKRCGLKGATVNCLKRGCGSVMHIGCAKFCNWSIDEVNYKAFCTDHKV